jgi:hypothetical protein
LDTLTFVAEIFKAAIWPIIVIAAIIFLRKPLCELLPHLRHFKYKDIEFVFDSVVRVIAEETVRSAPEDSGISMRLMGGRTYEKAKRDPTGVVQESWSKMEHTIRELAATHGTADLEHRLIAEIAEELMRRGIIKAEDYSLFNSLRSVRSIAAHYPDSVSPWGATTFGRMANQWIRRVRS